MMTQELIKNPFLEEVPEGGDLDGNGDGAQEQEAAEKKEDKVDEVSQNSCNENNKTAMILRERASQKGIF